MQWRPAPGKWSAHEVIVHCADSETNAVARIRFLLAEKQPVIQGYDQDRWARELDYHALPVETALATVAAVRANTVPLLKRMSERDWQRTGTHTESGHYAAEDWLTIYADLITNLALVFLAYIIAHQWQTFRQFRKAFLRRLSSLPLRSSARFATSASRSPGA